MPEPEASRWKVRAFVFAVLFSNVLITGAFFAGVIREPYPAVILPSFDQVLVDSDGATAFIVPRFEAKLSSGESASISVNQFLDDVPYSLWLVGRLAPPPNVELWKPALPSYGYIFRNPTQSLPFLDYLADRAHKFGASPAENGLGDAYIQELNLVWEKRRFELGKGQLVELSPDRIGSVAIPIRQHD
jgi:hypothetical protein